MISIFIPAALSNHDLEGVCGGGEVPRSAHASSIIILKKKYKLYSVSYSCVVSTCLSGILLRFLWVLLVFQSPHTVQRDDPICTRRPYPVPGSSLERSGRLCRDILSLQRRYIVLACVPTGRHGVCPVLTSSSLKRRPVAEHRGRRTDARWGDTGHADRPDRVVTYAAVSRRSRTADVERGSNGNDTWPHVTCMDAPGFTLAWHWPTRFPANIITGSLPVNIHIDLFPLRLINHPVLDHNAENVI